MRLHKIVRNEKSVVYTIDRANDSGHVEESTSTAPEAPRPELDEALANLASVVARVMELASAVMIEPYSLSVSVTKHGTRSVLLGYTRTLGTTKKSYKFATVAFQIDDPADGEIGERVATMEEVSLILAAISEGERYANGDRQQILLPLEDGDAEPLGGKQGSDERDLFDEEDIPL